MRKHYFKKTSVSSKVISTKDIKSSEGELLDKIRPIYSLGEFKKAKASYNAIHDTERDNTLIPATIKAINALMCFPKHRGILLMI